jgi:serine/threonine protein kinase
VDLSGLKFHSSSGYAVVGEIGRGGMGIVLLAEKNSEGVTDLVALKTIRTQSADHEARLKREANTAAGLRHENIVKTYGLESIPYSQLPPEFLKEFDSLSFENARRAERRPVTVVPRLADPRTKLRVQPEAGGERKIFLMVMDYIEGTDIRVFQNDHLRRDLLMPVPLAAFIVSRVARALAYAHQTIIHRDISPENLLVNTQGVVKLSDFGVAVTDHAEGITGKIPYLSPEQIFGQAVDARTDLYSLGLVLYLLLTGIPLQRVPAKLPVAERINHIRRLLARPFPAAAAVRPDVPAPVSEICARLLEREPGRRYAKAEEVARDLEQRYLYAKGFGPTNNSLQAYLEIFDAQFKEISTEQLQQLPFLLGGLQRHLDPAHAFTPEGRKLLNDVLSR